MVLPAKGLKTNKMPQKLMNEFVVDSQVIKLFNSSMSILHTC